MKIRFHLTILEFERGTTGNAKIGMKNYQIIKKLKM